ncbi:MAG: 30S ribosomal protein S12 methylthiotransferase RimO [Lachnospiraceae bacterium]|nr:30S ribosomal protein S12 methylthiotransferase RimO [Lachnospiraceae bacterium]
MNILLVSLGCDKNLCDSEAMLGLLRNQKYNITNDENDADVVIVNTCSFIHDAMEESINTILEMAELKKNRLKYLIVTGCLAERFKEEIFDEIPEVDACLGTSSFDRIIQVVEALEQKDRGFDSNDDKHYDDLSFKNNKVFCFDNLDKLATVNVDRVITSSTFMGYLKIAEGCNKFCTYCVIPHIRGRYRSVPMEKLVKEAEYMASQGIKELILVAQETTCYGIDLYGQKSLHILVRELAKIEGIEWIRLLYCYPEEIDDNLIELYATENKLCKYIDMPLQHSEDSILKRMGRKTDKASIKSVIAKLREKCPEIAIRTTFITGFPGETEDEHEALMEFVDEMELDRLGVFTYSREDGTPAASFENQVDEDVASTWRNEIMELQQEVSLDKNMTLVGTIQKVIIEGYSPEEDVYVGRTYRDAPGIDGMVFVECGYELISGTIVNVMIKEAGPYDLIGGIVDELT